MIGYPRNLLAKICACVIAAGLAGCGSDLPQTVPVTGTVTFDGAAPPGPGIVYFLPQEAAAGFPSRPGSGDFDAQGKYSATTFAPRDGLMPGKYTVYIECWQTPPNMEGKPVKSYVPKKFQDAQTSGMKLDVAPGSRSIEQNFEVVSK